MKMKSRVFSWAMSVIMVATIISFVPATKSNAAVDFNAMPTPTPTPTPAAVMSVESFYNGTSEALYVDNSLSLKGSSTVSGTVVSNFTASNQLSFDSSGGQYVSGDLFVKNPSLSKNSFAYGSTKIFGNVYLITQPNAFTLPPFPSYPDQSSLPTFTAKFVAGWNPSPPYHINTSAWYKGGIDILSELIFDIGNDDLIIRTKYLRVSGSGKL